MADIPIYPDGENLEKARDFLSIQKELADIMRKQKSVYEDIGHISSDIEAKVRVRYEREKDFFNQIKMQKTLLYREELKGHANMDGAERKSHKAALTSIRSKIKVLHDQIKISREISSMEMEMAKKQHEEDTKWFDFARNQMGEITGIQFKQFSEAKKTGLELRKLGVTSDSLAFTYGAILMMLKGTFELFKGMDKAAWEFRKAMGMTRAESKMIRKDAEGLAVDYMSMSVTIDGIYKSYQAIGKSVGGVHNVTKDMARDVSLMSAQLGISEETSAKFMQNLAAISKNTMDSQASMMGLAQAMSSAAGVNLGEVMSDVAKASGPTLTMMSRLPNLALRSTIELRRMGTSLADAAKSSRHILDFQTSMDEEMNASVLLGRSINLQRARELAYRRDIEGSTKEILRITKSVDFANLDVFQQEAFANATGRTVDELMKMLQADKQIAQVKRNGTAQQKAELANYEKMRQENEKAAKARGKDAMIAIQTMANQERMTAITAKWNQILAQAQSWLLPLVDGFLAMVIPAMDIARGIFAWSGGLKLAAAFISNIGSRALAYYQEIETYGLKTVGIFQKMWYYVGEIAWAIEKWASGGKNAFSSLSWIAKIRGWFSPISAIGKIFGTIGSWFAKIGGFIGKIVAPIGKIFGLVGKFAGFIGFFAKWIPIVGWVIMAFQLIGKLVGLISDYFKNWSNMSVGQRIIQGLLIIPKALWAVLVQPFIDAFKYIWSFFGGRSPSLLGLGIVKGIASIGTMLFNAIISPYKMAFNWIINKFSGIGKFLGKLFGKTESVEKKAQAAYVPAVTITPNGTQIETPKAKAETAAIRKEFDNTKVMSEETGQKMVALLEKILAKDNSIRMDGQLFSATLARGTEFRGGYGVNKVA